MKKLFVVVAALSLFVCNSSAYGQDAPPRQTLIVNSFSNNANVVSSLIAQIREAVIIGLSDKDRFNVIDANSSRAMQNIKGKTEDVVTEKNVLSSSNSDAVNASGADYVLSGSVNNFWTEQRTDERTGKVTYATTIVLSVSINDIAKGAVVGKETLSGYSTQDDEQTSVEKACNSLANSMSGFVNRNFKVKTRIVRLESTNDRGKLKYLYVNCGSNAGLEYWDCFDVAVVRQIAGREAAKVIGKLRVVEVVDENMCKCTITSGADEISAAFNEGKELNVTSGVRFLD